MENLYEIAKNEDYSRYLWLCHESGIFPDKNPNIELLKKERKAKEKRKVYFSFLEKVDELESRGYHPSIHEISELLIDFSPKKFGEGGNQQIYTQGYEEVDYDQRRFKTTPEDIRRIYKNMIKYATKVVTKKVE